MGAQMSKTDNLLDLIGARLDQKPCPILYVGPTKQFLNEQFEPRIMKLLDEAPRLAAKVARGKRMTKYRKNVAGVTLRLAHAGSTTALKSDPQGLLIVDEYAEMRKRQLKGAGDPLSLAEARGDTYADFVTVVTSTPSTGVADTETDPDTGLEFWSGDAGEVECPVWRLFLQGTRKHWAWFCKHCDEPFIPRFKDLRWPDKATPREARWGAWVECPRCGGKHTDADKPSMNERGVYIAPGQRIVGGEVVGDPPDVRADSYWVSGLASPFVPWGERAEKFLEATNARDMEKIQDVLNQGFGELWAPKGGETPELVEIIECVAPYKMGEIPTGVVVLTCGIDVQKNRLIYGVRGWGVRGESWLVDFGELWGPTAEPEVWDALANYLQTPIGGRRIRATLIDSGFRPNKKEAGAESIVYDFCRRYQHLAKPCKGHDTWKTPLSVASVEVDPGGTRAKYGLELVHINSDFAKLWVHERIRFPSDREGAWHLPEDIGEKFGGYFEQVISESRIRKPSGRVSWVQRRKDNHALDIEGMNWGAGYILNVQRIEGQRAAPAPPEGQVLPAQAAAVQKTNTRGPVRSNFLRR